MNAALSLSGLLILSALGMAVWTAISAVRNQPIGAPHLAGLLAVEMLALLQCVVGISALSGGVELESRATFISYLVTVPLLIPAGIAWSRAERSRSATLVVTVACVAVPVMTARLLQMLAGHG